MDKVKGFVWGCAVCAVITVLGRCGGGAESDVVSDTVIVRDTVVVREPVAVDSSVVGGVVVRLPVVSDDGDDGGRNCDIPKLGNLGAENISPFPTDSAENILLFPTGDNYLDLVCKKEDVEIQTDSTYNGTGVKISTFKHAYSDSVEVVVPITQVVYEDSTYKAYVSGFMPSLDSIIFYPQTVTINNRFKPPEKRWGLGVQVGYTVPHGWYVGVGVSYNLITW